MQIDIPDFDPDEMTLDQCKELRSELTALAVQANKLKRKLRKRVCRLEHQAKYHGRIAAGLCPRCEAKPEAAYIFCRNCIAKRVNQNADRVSARTLKYKLAGKCGCGREPIPTKSKCEKCTNAANRFYRRHRERLIREKKQRTDSGEQHGGATEPN